MSHGNIHYGKAIAAARKEMRLTQAKLAERIQTHRGHLAHIELGRQLPSPELASRIEYETGVRMPEQTHGYNAERIDAIDAYLTEYMQQGKYGTSERAWQLANTIANMLSQARV